MFFSAIHHLLSKLPLVLSFCISTRFWKHLKSLLKPIICFKLLFTKTNLIRYYTASVFITFMLIGYLE